MKAEKINDIKIKFATFHDEMEAWEKWVEQSPFGKALHELCKVAREIEGEEKSGLGISTTPLASEIAVYDWGFNGLAKECADHLAYYLTNHDYVCIKPNGIADVKESNHPNVARILNRIMDMVGTDAKWVRERLYQNI